MADIDMLTAIGEEIKVAGKSYRLGVMDRTDWALVNEQILSLRADPVSVVDRMAATGKVPSGVLEKLYNRAYDDAIRTKIVSGKDFDDFLYGIEGQQFVFWLRMKKCQPDVSETEASRVQAEWAKECFTGLTAKLMQKFPKMTKTEVEQAQLAQEDDLLNKMVTKGLGMPAGNPETPEKPGTPTDH